MKRIEKNWSDLDFDTVDFDDGNWGFSSGGHPHNTGEWSICHADDDLNETRYKLPECINHMMRLQRKWGDDDAIGRIKHALRL